MMAHRTTIDLESNTRDDLRAEKRGNETYDDVVNRLLEHEPDTQAVRNALDDLQSAADFVGEHGLEHDADMIRESVETLREELYIGFDE